jgi:hypothetical protein
MSIPVGLHDVLLFDAYTIFMLPCVVLGGSRRDLDPCRESKLSVSAATKSTTHAGLIPKRAKVGDTIRAATLALGGNIRCFAVKYQSFALSSEGDQPHLDRDFHTIVRTY